MSILGEKSYTVVRMTAVPVADHRRPPPTEATFSIQASIQPLKEEEAEQFSVAGVRTDRMLKAYTTALLRTANEATQNPADEVVVDGERCVVVQVKRYDDGILDHYRCVLARRERV